MFAMVRFTVRKMSKERVANERRDGGRDWGRERERVCETFVCVCVCVFVCGV